MMRVMEAAGPKYTGKLSSLECPTWGNIGGLSGNTREVISAEYAFTRDGGLHQLRVLCVI